MEKKNGAGGSTAAGVLYIVAAFTTWGLLPLYWKFLDRIPAEEIFAHRVLWSFVFIFFILVYRSGLNDARKVVVNPRSVFGIFICAVLISINWFVYIWAVNTGRVVESSMGYYMNPLIVVFLARVVLKEKLGFWKMVSLLLAFIGVTIITVQYGKVPWIALVLALSFALYGLAKKLVNVDPLVGLALETLMITPFALAYILLKQAKGIGALGSVPLVTTLLLLCSGIATATPLLWFSEGAKRVPLSTVGFGQYISPTISLLLGIFVFKERFTTVHIISFGFIWCALVLYTLVQVGFLNQPKPICIKVRENGQ